MIKKYFLLLFFFNFTQAFSNIYISNYVFYWLDKNPTHVANFLLKNKENEHCAYILGRLFLGEFQLFTTNFEKARYFLELSANKNYPPAINALGDGHYSGDIYEKNLQKAIVCYEKAAKLGFGPAQFNAGVSWSKAGQSKKELKKAIFWLDKASKNKHDLNDMTIFAAKYKENAEHALNKIVSNQAKIR